MAEETLDMDAPGVLAFDECLVRVADEMKAIWKDGAATDKTKRVVRVEFGWGFLSDSVSRDTEKFSEKEVIDFLESYKPFHGKRVKVSFSVSARRDGNFANAYRLVDIKEIELIEKSPRRASLAGSV